MKRLWFLLILLVPLLLAALYVHNERENERVHLVQYDFVSERLPAEFNGYRILLISDLHNAPFSQQITDHIAQVRPDITVFTGDMVQLPGWDMTEVLNIVNTSKDITDFYAVTGNHEAQKHLWDITSTLEKNGVCMVESRDVTLHKDGAEINLAGLADPMTDQVDDAQMEKIQETLDHILGNNQDMFTVLLSHRANLYPGIKDCGADLILSGHLHGGIIRLPFIGGIIGEKNHSILPKYEYGFYKEGGSAAMIVSGGCDKNPKKKRFFNPPEVVLVTLKTEG